MEPCRKCRHGGVEVERSGLCRFCEGEENWPQWMKDFEENNPTLYLQKWTASEGISYLRIAERSSSKAINFVV